MPETQNLKRYTYWCRASHGHEPLEHADGELVLWTDYERLLSELRHLENLNDFTAPLSCATHGLVPNLALFDNKCPACERDRLAHERDEAIRHCQGFHHANALNMQRVADLTAERDRLIEDRDFWKAEANRWQETAHRVEAEIEGLIRDRDQWHTRHDRERAAHATNLTQQQKVEAERDRLRTVLKRLEPEVSSRGMAIILSVLAESGAPRREAEVSRQSFYAWRPIETAPQDGAPVLVATENGVGEAEWYGERDGWWWVNNAPTDSWGNRIYPTHWIPLPPPPESFSEGER